MALARKRKAGHDRFQRGAGGAQVCAQAHDGCLDDVQFFPVVHGRPFRGWWLCENSIVLPRLRAPTLCPPPRHHQQRLAGAAPSPRIHAGPQRAGRRAVFRALGRGGGFFFCSCGQCRRAWAAHQSQQRGCSVSQVLDAAYRVVHDYPGGAASLAPRLGDKSPTTLNHELLRTGQAKLGLQTAVDISVFTGDARILDSFAAVMGRMTLPLPELLRESGDNILQRQGAFLQEVSDVVRELGTTLSDGAVNRNERDAFRREVGELIASAQAVLAEVERRYEEGQRAHDDTHRMGGGV